jgi:hypothetical protein
MTTTASMVHVYKELSYAETRKYVQSLLLVCSNLFRDKLAVHYCIASVVYTGLESLNLLLGFKSSVSVNAQTFSELDVSTGVAGHLRVTPVPNISIWNELRQQWEQSLLKESLVGYSCVITNIGGYRPALDLQLSTPNYAAAVVCPAIEGYVLRYHKSKLGEVLQYILGLGQLVDQFSLMMSRELHVYVALMCRDVCNESFVCGSDVPYTKESIKTLKHYQNTVGKHLACGIAITKADADAVCDLEVKPSMFDSFYKALEKTPDKILYVKQSRGCIGLVFSKKQSK